tara:strand:- start:8 stop:229 length:222 start_codon:yes stop_codon:yes gene_type:complete
MQTNLTMVGDKWAVEIIGGPDEETLTKTFSGREQATNQIRLWGNGQSEKPVLKKKNVKSEKSVKSKKVETVKK